MEARIDAPLSCTHALNTEPDAMATRNPVADGRNGTPANGTVV